MNNIKLILKKWYVVIFCALITSGALYFEKSKINIGVAQTGDMVYTRIIKFNTIPRIQLNNTTSETDVVPVVNTLDARASFNKSLRSNFDVLKLDKNLEKMGEDNQIKWLSKHFRVSKLGPGTYELVMEFFRTDPKDSQYIDENSIALLDLYEHTFQDASSLLTNDNQISIVKNYKMLERLDNPDYPTLAKKYAIIGFILGALLGVVIILVIRVVKGK